MIHEHCTFKGKYIIEDSAGFYAEWDNLLTDGFFSTVAAAFLSSASPSIQVHSLAIGSGSTAPQKTNTELETLLYRYSVASASILEGEGICYFTASISAPEELQINEVGAYGNETSNTLYSRALINYKKPAGVVAQLTWMLSVSGV